MSMVEEEYFELPDEPTIYNDGDTKAIGKVILKLDEVADILRVSVMTVRRLIRRKQLAAVKIGGQLMVRTIALETYIQRNTLKAIGEV